MLRRSVEISDVKKKLIVPDNYVIYQNYPNPFNPSTVISFYIPSQAEVYVDIYNSIGQRIKQLVSGKEFRAGNWKVIFNGASLSSGVYFALVRIKGENSMIRKTLKMLLLK